MIDEAIWLRVWGRPVPPPPKWPPTSPVEQVFFSDIKGELKAIRDYWDHMEEFRSFGDSETADILEHILHEEEHHLEELIARLEAVRA